jgi:hypothetical protein
MCINGHRERQIDQAKLTGNYEYLQNTLINEVYTIIITESFSLFI